MNERFVPDIRSFFIAPANRADLVAKFPRFGADCCIVDLEDGTPPDAKEAARAGVGDLVRGLRAQGFDRQLGIRVDEPWSPRYLRDLEAAWQADVDFVVVPKLERTIAAMAIAFEATAQPVKILNIGHGYYAAAQLAYADSVPTGTYRDMTQRLPLVEPERILVPALVARGEHDGIAAMSDLLAFFERLPSGDKQSAVVSDVAHVTPLGRYRYRMWRLLDAFFTLRRDDMPLAVPGRP